MEVGTTSACAENTLATLLSSCPMGNYLRVRGEYRSFEGVVGHVTELPPRARRILHVVGGNHLSAGTTSACAENTDRSDWPGRGTRNYLRVRGEYGVDAFLLGQQLELPPRARRIQASHSISSVRIGTTSACAENTSITGSKPGCSWNYLRVRGEY